MVDGSFIGFAGIWSLTKVLDRLDEKSEEAKEATVVTIRPEEDLHVCTRWDGNPSSNCSDISH